MSLRVGVVFYKDEAGNADEDGISSSANRCNVAGGDMRTSTT